MPNWNEVLEELKETGSTYDIVRRKYLALLSEHTKRNVIAYYSGWLQKQGIRNLSINDADKNGFMAVIKGLDRKKGLDLILHTPGGEIAATESIVDYLRSMFGADIRAIVPQLAMSAGTMIACSCKSIVLGKHSSLGPIDPQLNGLAAHGIIEEINTAHEEISNDPTRAIIWQPILQKYHPTLVGECQKAIQWSEELAADWLRTNMFKRVKNPSARIKKIITELGDHAINLNHARHMSLEKCREMKLKIEALEKSPKLQDLVLSVHNTFIHTLSSTNAFKIIENQSGTAYIQSIPPQQR